MYRNIPLPPSLFLCGRTDGRTDGRADGFLQRLCLKGTILVQLRMPSGVNATGFAPGAYEKNVRLTGRREHSKTRTEENERAKREREREREKEEGVLTKSNESLNSGR